jgi:signal transduction histidine kinase
VTNIEACHQLIADTVPLNLVYYAHIPTAIISLAIGFFVFFKNPKMLLSRLLLGLSLSFSLWLGLDLIVWALNYNSALMMFAWAPLEMLSVLFFIFGLYFVYVYIDGKDISLAKKIILGFLFLPLVIFASTRFNLEAFTMQTCEAIEGQIFLDYALYFKIIILTWTIILSIQRYFKADKLMRKQIILLGLGISFFFISFFVASYVAMYFDNFIYELYGLFSMTVFMGFISYLIVKFEAFSIKMAGAQALIFTLVILIGSQFAFINNSTNKVLNSITLLLAIIFGYFLIQSVKKEIAQKEQLEITNAELSQRKDELQFISDRLAESNDRLRTLDNAKTEFISIASHQLRTPPTAIKGYTSLIAEGSFGPINDKQQDALTKIAQANDRQIRFVEDLLNVSRIESGRMEYSFSENNVEDLCQNVVDNLFFKARDNKLYLDFKKSETELPKASIDGPKVLEVISNLVDNALKYTQRGGVTVRVEVCARMAESCVADKHIRITVSDTGIGIPATELPYLFAKFSRGKDISRLNTGGTGLGLYVGKIMIEANGGHIWAESDGEGMGSRFIIELPIKQAENLKNLG